MNCDCKMGQVCINLDPKYQAIDWISQTGKKYRKYLDIRQFNDLFPKNELKDGDEPTWGCIQRQFYEAHRSNQ